MLGTIAKCPNCGWGGYKKLKPFNTDGYDPLMVKVQCTMCKTEYEIAPPPWYKKGELDYDSGQ